MDRKPSTFKEVSFFLGRSIEVEYFGDEILGLEVLELIGTLPNKILFLTNGCNDGVYENCERQCFKLAIAARTFGNLYNHYSY